MNSQKQKTTSIRDVVKDPTKSSDDKIGLISHILFPLFFDNPRDLSEKEKIFIYVMMIDNEVNNGGFSQFFFNCTGKYWQEVLDSLKMIKADKVLQLFKKAIRLFPNSEVPANQEERNQIMQNLGERGKILDELDQEFYAAENEMTNALLDFIEQNIEDFEH